MKALITTTPFEIEKSIYIKKLKNLGVDIICNQKNSKFSKNELISFGKDCDFLIAGTDQLDQFVLKKLKNLKLISRVGVGYDNIDMDFCNNHDIKVTITPEAPVSAVSELTIGLIFSLLRLQMIAPKSQYKFRKNLSALSNLRGTSGLFGLFKCYAVSWNHWFRDNRLSGSQST